MNAAILSGFGRVRGSGAALGVVPAAALMPALALMLALPVMLALALVTALAGPARAAEFGLFGERQVEVQFATAEGKAMADAAVRVFAPGQPNRPVLTGRTDAEGKFYFAADRTGLWTAEARIPGQEVARASVRVAEAGTAERLSPLLLIGLLVLLLAIAVWYRVLRARAGRR